MTAQEALLSVALKALGPGTDEAEQARAESIVDDMLAESRDVGEAALALSVAIAESGLSKEIEDGSKTGDSGRSVCIMQINVGAGQTLEGWTRADLIADRRKCIRAGLRHLRSSLAQCRQNRADERLAAYVSGSCTIGLAESRRRTLMAKRLSARIAR